MLRLCALVLVCFAVLAGSASADVFDDNPAAVATGPGAVTVFVRGADGTILSRSAADGAWGAWSAVPGLEAASGPAAVRYGASVMVFVRGVDSQIWQNTLTGGAWTGWITHSGAVISAPAAALRGGSTTVDLIARGTDNRMYYRTFVGGGQGWGGWNGLATSMTHGPAATGTQWEGLPATHLLARGENGSLRSIHLNGNAQDWTDLGGYIVGSPASASAAPGAIDIFALAGDLTLHHRSLSTAWRRVDFQPLSSSPAAVSDAPGREQLFARVGSELWTRTVTHAGTDKPVFGAWSSLGVPSAPGPAGPPAPPADTDGDGVPDATDLCATTPGALPRSGCPAGLLADPSIRYRVTRGGIKVVAYQVKATRGARVTVRCSRGCRRTVLRGRGSTRPVRVGRLNGRRLKNGTRITVTASMPGRLTTTVVDRVTRSRRVEGRPVCKPVGC